MSNNVFGSFVNLFLGKLLGQKDGDYSFENSYLKTWLSSFGLAKDTSKQAKLLKHTNGSGKTVASTELFLLQAKNTKLDTDCENRFADGFFNCTIRDNFSALEKEIADLAYVIDEKVFKENIRGTNLNSEILNLYSGINAKNDASNPLKPKRPSV